MFVMGPAGSGKSTFCNEMQNHQLNLKRSINLVNMDPAANDFEYEPTIDIKELITLQLVMEELGFGPNGGLMYCFDYLADNLEWLQEQLQGFEDDNLVVDFPGQIELYIHSPAMKKIIKCFENEGYLCCSLYLIDSSFLQDGSKFLGGTMGALAAMLQLPIPHLNVLTKMDLVKNDVEKYLNVDTDILLSELNDKNKKFKSLNQSLVQLIEEYSLVSFVRLDYKDEETLQVLLQMVDRCCQYGEDAEPKEIQDNDEEE